MIFDNAKVGDRFREVRSGRLIEVTEITVMGFKYKFEVPYHAFPARWGPSLVTEGELYIKNPDLECTWDHLYEKVVEPKQLNLPL